MRMKNVVFLTSHLGSGSETLIHLLNRNPRLQIETISANYTHPLDLESLTGMPHKNETTAAYWGDHLVFNFQLGHKALYGLCKFLYMVRPARPSLNEIVAQGYPHLGAVRYYCFRLRRMWDMLRKTPNAILFTHDEAVSGKIFPEIEEYLGLNKPIETDPALFQEETEDAMPLDLVQEAQDSYEKYLYLMRSQALAQQGCIPK